MPDDGDQRQDSMQRDVLLIATAAASLLNGQSFSPLLTMGAILLKPFVAGTLLASPIVFLYLSSLFVSLLTLLIAGIPAALYERMQGHTDSTPTSLGIWFAATLVLTLPTFMSMGSV
jgi:ribose/xylose/arabinose/galactoside ABC-type transport system permease subunit